MRLILVLAITLTSVQARDFKHTIPVYLQAGPDIRVTLLVEARHIASELLASADVRLHWVSKPGPEALTLRLIHGLSAGATLASAEVFQGTEINVFIDTIRHHSYPGVKLGYVFAHEITHMLQGCDTHSATGVMKARWSDADWRRMNTRQLVFEKRDIWLIDLGMQGRQARMLVTINTPRP